MPDVFLIYSRDDRRIMEPLRDYLRVCGLDTLTDEHIPTNTSDYHQQIEQMIRDCPVMIVLLSPSAVRVGSYVLNEINYALLQKREIFPVIIAGRDEDAIPIQLSSYQYTDIRGRTLQTPNEAYSRLALEIAEIIGTKLLSPRSGQHVNMIVSGDYVAGDKVILGDQVNGDKITLGDIVGNISTVIRKTRRVKETVKPSLIDQYEGCFVMPSLRPMHTFLPGPLEWCEIPSGQVTISGGRKMGDYEQTFNVRPFYMAKYPVTCEQFQVFVEAEDGFSNERWWHDLAADADHRKAPGIQRCTHAVNLPRENVSWYDGIAFCRWLSEHTGRDIRLPSEWEWQRAAQGPDDREFPWGNELDFSNMHISRNLVGDIDHTIPVTTMKGGASPFGVMHMIGNVWEWCLNEYKEPRNIGFGGSQKRVVRGGSWGDHSFLVPSRISDRDFFDPEIRCNEIGFRIVLYPFS